jgi:type II secretory pathway pseudopilin PulG
MVKVKNGFGLIEIILAIGIFALIASTGVITILHSFSINRLGEEQTQAANYANQGLEAVRSIRKNSWSSLTDGTYGLSAGGGSWAFSGASDTSGKITRTVKIETGNRDGSGNIVDVGTPDPNLKKVTSTAAWNFGANRNNSVITVEYLTNFSKTIANAGDGLLTYSNASILPKWKSYSNISNTFAAVTDMPSGAVARNWASAVSPTKNEMTAVYTNNTGVLRVMCFNGSTWSQDFSVTVGGTGTTRRFDVAYEKTTGDVMVAYSTNTATTNELAYITKPGASDCGSANWSGVTNLDPVRTTGTIHWVKISDDVRAGSNLLAMIWADANADLSAMVWSGTAWVNEPAAVTEASLEIVTTAQDVEDFDIEYESISGDIMLVWANSAGSNAVNGVRYRVCTGGTSTCTWGAVTTPPTFADDATNLDLAADPSTDAMVFASIGNAGSDMQSGYWSGTAWTNGANRDTSCAAPAAGTKRIAVGWLNSGATKRSIVVYNDSGSGAVNWYIANAGTFTVQTDWVTAPVMSTTVGSMDLVQDPKNLDRLMLVVADGANDLFTKRVVMTSVPAFTWTNADGGVAHDIALPANIAKPFTYNYWRN